MKKIVILTVLSFVLITGCGKEKTMTCTRTMSQNSVNFDLKYEVESLKGNVTRIKSTEMVKSNDKNVLGTYKETVEKTYEPYQDVEHYNYSVEITDDTLISKTDLDYTKIDMDKMIEIDSANAKIIKDGKIKLEDIRNTYEAMGLICEEK